MRKIHNTSRTGGSAHRLGRARRGAAAVEAAILSPLLVLLILGAMDIGQFVNVQQSISNASREGARMACRSTTGDVGLVEARVYQYLIDTFPNVQLSDFKTAVQINVIDANGSTVLGNNLGLIESGQTISVRVALDYNAVRSIPSVFYWNVSSNETTTIGRRE